MTQPFSDSILCGHCGAANPANTTICRRCDLPLAVRAGDAQMPTRQESLARMSQGASQYSLTSLLLGITIVSVCLGVFVQAPGIGIFIGIACLPAFIRTALLIRKREQLGRPTSTGQKALAFVGSVVFACIAAFVVLVASVGTFCTICLTGSAARGSEDVLILISALVAGVVTVAVGFGLYSWMRSRWRRDIDHD